AVEIDVDSLRSKTQEVSRRVVKAGGARGVDEQQFPLILEVRGRFEVKVCDQQVEQTIAIQVAAGDAHAGPRQAVSADGRSSRPAPFDESKSPAEVAGLVVEQEIWCAVVGDVNIGPAVTIQIGDDDSQSLAVLGDDPR